MLLEESLFGKPSVRRYRKPCTRPKTRSRTTGRCRLPSLKRTTRSKAKVNTKKRVPSGGINVKGAKQMLSFKVMSMSGLRTAPSWITSFKGVSGPSVSEKVGRVNRMLLACKQMGIPLVQKNGKKYKAFSTLKSQCGVRFTKENKNNVVSIKGVENNLLAKLAQMRQAKLANTPPSPVLVSPPLAEVGEEAEANTFAGFGRFRPVRFGRPSRFGFRYY